MISAVKISNGQTVSPTISATFSTPLTEGGKTCLQIGEDLNKTLTITLTHAHQYLIPETYRLCGGFDHNWNGTCACPNALTGAQQMCSWVNGYGTDLNLKLDMVETFSDDCFQLLYNSPATACVTDNLYPKFNYHTMVIQSTKNVVLMNITYNGVSQTKVWDTAGLTTHKLPNGLTLTFKTSGQQTPNPLIGNMIASSTLHPDTMKVIKNFNKPGVYEYDRFCYYTYNGQAIDGNPTTLRSALEYRTTGCKDYVPRGDVGLKSGFSHTLTYATSQTVLEYTGYQYYMQAFFLGDKDINYLSANHPNILNSDVVNSIKGFRAYICCSAGSCIILGNIYGYNCAYRYIQITQLGQWQYSAQADFSSSVTAASVEFLMCTTAAGNNLNQLPVSIINNKVVYTPTGNPFTGMGTGTFCVWDESINTKTYINNDLVNGALKTYSTGDINIYRELHGSLTMEVSVTGTAEDIIFVNTKVCPVISSCVATADKILFSAYSTCGDGKAFLSTDSLNVLKNHDYDIKMTATPFEIPIVQSGVERLVNISLAGKDTVSFCVVKILVNETYLSTYTFPTHYEIVTKSNSYLGGIWNSLNLLNGQVSNSLSSFTKILPDFMTNFINFPENSSYYIKWIIVLFVLLPGIPLVGGIIVVLFNLIDKELYTIPGVLKQIKSENMVWPLKWLYERFIRKSDRDVINNVIQKGVKSVTETYKKPHID
jgi:hypothetical protein